jgi:hypothetical protein
LASLGGFESNKNKVEIAEWTGSLPYIGSNKGETVRSLVRKWKEMKDI